jgi:histidine triad (HIT) family protein
MKSTESREGDTGRENKLAPSSSADDNLCIFCEIIAFGDAQLIIARPHSVAFFPLLTDSLAPGHTLVIPRRHCGSILDANPFDINAAMALAQQVSTAMLTSLGAAGVNILNASGSEAGQSVHHLHFHVVPRWHDDSADMWPTTPVVHMTEGNPRELLSDALAG